jgi:hypothetical protein
MVADRVAAQTRSETSHLSRRTFMPNAVICKKATKPLSDTTNSSRSCEYKAIATGQARHRSSAIRSTAAQDYQEHTKNTG